MVYIPSTLIWINFENGVLVQKMEKKKRFSFTLIHSNFKLNFFLWFILPSSLTLPFQKSKVEHACFIWTCTKFDFATPKFSKTFFSAVHTTPPQWQFHISPLWKVFSKSSKDALSSLSRSRDYNGWFRNLNTTQCTFI